jgi:hypothetical protein
MILYGRRGVSNNWRIEVWIFDPCWYTDVRDLGRSSTSPRKGTRLQSMAGPAVVGPHVRQVLPTHTTYVRAHLSNQPEYTHCRAPGAARACMRRGPVACTAQPASASASPPGTAGSGRTCAAESAADGGSLPALERVPVTGDARAHRIGQGQGGCGEGMPHARRIPHQHSSCGGSAGRDRCGTDGTVSSSSSEDFLQTRK